MTIGWNFSPYNYGRRKGISDSGVETFRGDRYRHLAKVICQNSLDAIKKDEETVKIDFQHIEIDKKDIPGYERYIEVFNQCYETSKIGFGKVKDFFAYSNEILAKEKISVLRISDFNTTGLTGSKEEKDTAWNDLSGDRLRDWIGLSREEFYATDRIAHLPMDFYYPGKAQNGDLPPRKGFAEKWHPLLLEAMPNVETIILIGSYAQKYYLGKRMEKNLTETVRNFKKYLPEYFLLVHPSLLNIRWFKQNTWYESDVLPVLKEIVRNPLKKAN